MKKFLKETFDGFNHYQKFAKLFGFLGLILTFLLLTPYSSNATHFRYGTITWEPVQGQSNTIKFTVRAAWRRDFFPSNVTIGQTINTSNGSNANFRFGGNTNLGTNRPMYATVTAVNISENWLQTEWIQIVTYSEPGDYTAFFQSCCRINELQNNNTNQSQNRANYRVETIVNVDSQNRPPSSSLPTIINLQTGLNTADIQVPGVDPDGDNINF